MALALVAGADYFCWLRVDWMHSRWTLCSLLAGEIATLTLLALVAIVEKLGRTRSTHGEAAAIPSAPDAYLELVLRSAHLGIWEWDLAAGRIYFDPRNLITESPLSKPPEINIERYRATIHPDDRERIDKALDAHLRGTAAFYDCEYRRRMPSGEWKWLHHVGKVVEFDGNEAAVRMTGTYRDVTDRKRAESELLALNEELIKQKQLADSATEAKSRFLACMSHEIRTPMNGVLGLTEVLLKTGLSHEQRVLVETIQGSGEMLMTVLNDILDISRIEAQKLEIEQSPFDLAETIERTVSLMAASGIRKGLQVSAEIEPNAARIVIGDASRVKQIVGNLLSNAIKFTTAGYARVVVNLTDLEAEHASFEILVQDSGMGIPQDVQRTIFDSFTQADITTARLFGGSGLGLTIVRHLVEMMGGGISVESQPGEGSTFRVAIRFPLAAAKVRVPEDFPVAASVAPAKGCSVLVAEDDPTNQLLVRRVLESAGLRVHVVADGYEAVEAARRGTYDLILMDAHMPRMDGVAGTRAIRALPLPQGNVPIIALTASAFSEDRDACLAAGMNGFVAKPFRSEELLSKCQQVLPTKIHVTAVESTPNSGYFERLSKYSPDLATDLVEIFLETAPVRFREMITAIEAEDRETARESAHYLRDGMCAAVMPDLEQALRKVELVSRSERDKLREQIDPAEITPMFEEICSQARQWLGDNPPADAPQPCAATMKA